jgi:hypothetical protein
VLVVDVNESCLITQVPATEEATEASDGVGDVLRSGNTISSFRSEVGAVQNPDVAMLLLLLVD